MSGTTETPAAGATIATAAAVTTPQAVDTGAAAAAGNTGALPTQAELDAQDPVKVAIAAQKAEADKKAALATDPVAKAAADKLIADKAEADKLAAKNTVPETYEFKAPEGLTLDPVQLEAFTPIAKELGLTNDQAQKLVDLQVAATTASAKKWTDTVAAWGEEAKADPVFGKQNFDQSTGYVAKFLDKYGSTEARKALDDSGMGNHPALLKLFRSAGAAMGEDTFTAGNSGGGGTPRTVAQNMFPGFK